MKIIIEEPSLGVAESLTVRCRVIQPKLLSLLNAFKLQDSQLIAHSNDEIHRVTSVEI